MALEDAAAESELKFSVGAGDLKRLARHEAMVASPTRRKLRSTYFDTPELALRERGVSLRIRKVEGRHVQTVKAGGGASLFDRDEWEQDVPGAAPTSETLAGTPVAALLPDGVLDLRPVFETSVTRDTRLWANGAGTVEISVDKGEIIARGSREPIRELELELKAGSSRAVFALAEQFGELANMRLLFSSKSDRGYRLANGGDKAFKADPPRLAVDATVRQAFQAMVKSCLQQISANAEVLHRNGEPVALHQTRIGLRRFRGALSLFKTVVEDDIYPLVKQEARWAAHELNAARELDVFLAHAEAHPLPDEPGYAPYLARLRTAREAAYARAVATLASDRFARFLLKTALWVEIGPWCEASGSEPDAVCDGEARTLAARALTALHRSVVKDRKRLTGKDPQARHAVRIKVKKLRYAAEAFESLFPEGGKARRRYLETLSALQDTLGGLNDMAAARHTALAPVAGSRNPQYAFVAGLIVASARRGERRLIGRAAKAHAALADAKPFWPSPRGEV